jgi:hypothetical protein
MHAADAVGLPLPQALQKLIDVNGFEEASARALATRLNKMVKNEHENHSKSQKHKTRRRGDAVATARQRYLLEMNPERHVQSAEVSMSASTRLADSSCKLVFVTLLVVVAADLI